MKASKQVKERERERDVKAVGAGKGRKLQAEIGLRRTLLISVLFVPFPQADNRIWCFSPKKKT